MNIKILGLASLLSFTAILGACAPATTDSEPTVEEKTEEVENSVDDTFKEAGKAVKDKATESVDAVKEGVENLQETSETEAKEEAN